jgi:signal transduction histidine kinase
MHNWASCKGAAMDKQRRESTDEIEKKRRGRVSKLDRAFAARHLKDFKNKLLAKWEFEVREQIPASEGKTSLVLSNTLPMFLDELIGILEKESPVTTMTFMAGMAIAHGAQRATMSGYFLPQLLLEFSILRQVINAELFSYESLSPEVTMTVNTVIDSAISLATTEFARVQGEAVRTALSRAESSNRDLEGFASVAAHDLKSPLATVIGFLDLLQDQVEPLPKSAEDQSIQIMKSTLVGMTSLIDHLLEYARIVGSELRLQQIYLDDVLAAAVTNLRSAIVNSGAKVVSDSLPKVLGDKQLLTQVFQNLIANAVKFHGNEAPEIRVGVESQEENWILSFKDNGVGFDPKFKREIFGLYKRLETPGRPSGSGIGLATCRSVVERHNGKIWAESEPGKGSSFYFTLPKIGRASAVDRKSSELLM